MAVIIVETKKLSKKLGVILRENTNSKNKNTLLKYLNGPLISLFKYVADCGFTGMVIYDIPGFDEIDSYEESLISEWSKENDIKVEIEFINGRDDYSIEFFW